MLAIIASTPISTIPDGMMTRYRQWLATGHAAGMSYMHNHEEIRQNPELLLSEAKTIISIACPYASSVKRDPALPQIASYALGDDYHDAIRKFLTPFIQSLKETYDGDYRLCIDSAPIFERYFAEKAGIGSRCDNGLISTPGFGTKIFLAEILTTAEVDIKPSYAEISEVGECSLTTIPEETFADWRCTHCGACRKACPAGALQSDSTVDARRCLSYLTIEHRGDWDEVGRAAMSTPAGRRTLYGCDLCQNVCPLNSPARESSRLPGIDDTRSKQIIPALRPREEILSLTPEKILSLTPESFSLLFRRSPIKRAKLAGLLRNARNLLPTSDSLH